MKTRKPNEPEPKRKNVLAIIREKIFVGRILPQKASQEWLGLPVRTLTAIECGQRPLTLRTAKIVSKKTGVSIESLMENSQSPVMATGQFFNAKAFKEYTSGKPKPISGAECFRFYILLCIKLGRVMLAAFMTKDAIFAVWKIRTALNQIGKDFPAFESTDNDIKQGIYQNPTPPETFDFEMQKLMATNPKPTKLWTAILNAFNGELSAIEGRQSKKRIGK
jgi:hypothetical protein